MIAFIHGQRIHFDAQRIVRAANDSTRSALRAQDGNRAEKLSPSLSAVVFGFSFHDTEVAQ